MKHIFLFVIVSVMTLCMLACSNESVDTPNETTEPGSETTVETAEPCIVHSVEWVPKDEGFHEGICKVCGSRINPSEHSMDNGRVTSKATVEAEGTRMFTCSICGYEHVEMIEKLTPIKEIIMSNIKEELMMPIFSGTTTKNETVMFIDKGDVKSLLYPIESIQSVTSYDGYTVYEEGKDYVLEDR